MRPWRVTLPERCSRCSPARCLSWDMPALPCLLCTRPAVEGSGEHLMPAVLGGSRVVRGLLCRSCNSSTGHQLDAALEQILRPLIVLFGIRNHRSGHLPTLTFQAEGVKYRYDRSAHTITLAHPTEPQLEHHPDGSLSLSASIPTGQPRVERQITQGLLRVLERTGRDPAQFRTEHHRTVRRETAPAVPIAFELNCGDPLLVRALTKIAFLTAADLLGRQAFRKGAFDPVRAVIRGEGPGTVTLWPAGAQPQPVPHHAVTLHLQNGTLSALVTLFGELNFLVPLGPLAAAPSPLPGRTFDPQAHRSALIHSPDVVFGDTDEAAVRGGLSTMLRAGGWDAVRDRIVHEALTASGIAQLQEGEMITEEMSDRFTRELMSRLDPYITGD